MTVLGVAPPPAGGLDVTLPGSGIRLAATRWPGHGTPVVLLHGLASQRRFWNPVARRLAGLPLLALDQRGHGDSDRPPTSAAQPGYDAHTVGSDLATAMDALGWSRAVVVGHSWGAAVAARFAADHPERTLALVAMDGGFTSPMRSGGPRSEVRRRLEPPRLALPPEEVVDLLSSHLAVPWTEEMAAAVLPIFEVGPDGLARPRLPFDTHMAIVDELLDHDAATTLTRVRCPAWLVACTPVQPTDHYGARKVEDLNALADVLAKPRLLHWVGAVHDVPLQWPDLVAGLVRAAVEDAAAI